MIQVEKLKLRIYEKQLSQRQVAKMLGISEKTFYDKMKKGVFNSNEIQALIDVLQIENPSEYFFNNYVA